MARGSTLGRLIKLRNLASEQRKRELHAANQQAQEIHHLIEAQQVRQRELEQQETPSSPYWHALKQRTGEAIRGRILRHQAEARAHYEQVLKPAEDALREAKIAVRALELLEDRRLAQADRDQAHQELQLMDEVALHRHRSHGGDD